MVSKIHIHSLKKFGYFFLFYGIAFKVAAIDIRYFARSKFFRSLDHEKNSTFI